MINDSQITRTKKWLVRLNIVAGILLGVLLQTLVVQAISYEWPIIIKWLATLPVFILGSFSGILLWKWTAGYMLAFGVGMWWGHKTRNE